MENQAEVLLYLLHEDYGASDAEIARHCGVSRQHINRVKQGHARASQALYTQLENLYSQLDTSNEPPPRKHYTWQSGRDPRQSSPGKLTTRAAGSTRVKSAGQLQRDTSARPIITPPISPMPIWQTYTGVEDI